MGLFFKSKKEKQEEEDLKEYLDLVDKMEEETDKELGKIKLTDLFKKDPEEEELLKYIPEEELKKEEAEKKTANIFSFITGGVLLSIIVVIIILLNVFSYVVKDDLHKIELANIQKYYKDRYGSSTKIDKIEYICYKDAEKNDVCSDVIYAKTNKDEVILKQGDVYADNITISKYYDDYKNYLNETNPNLDLIINNPVISDADLNPVYYKYIDYSKALPANDNFRNLLENKKIIVNDTIMYQGEIDIDGLKRFYDYLSPESKFVFIKVNKGIPSNVKIVTADALIDLYVTATLYPDNGITYYQLDPLVNNVSNVNINKISPSSIQTLDKNYEFTNAYSITTERGNVRSDNIMQIPTYYLVMFDNMINGDHMYEVGSSKELDPKQYKEYNSIYLGGKTYIVSNTNLILGNKQKIQKGLFN